MTGHKQTTDGQQYTTGYSYNLAGALIEETYPSGRVVKNVLDNSGDLLIVESRKNASSGFWHYADAFTYNAAGAVTAMQLGNGRWESTQFNSRLQPTQIALGTTPGTTDKLKLEYGYGTTANNGNVLTQDITVKRSGQSDLVFNQTYTYDDLNRLKIAEEKTGTTTNWKQTFTFDRYGNRRFDQSNTTVPASFANPNLTNPTFNASNNRMASGQNWTYDAAGNVTVDPDGRTFAYDAENKQVEVKNLSSATIGTYYFDGDGKRVKKAVPSSGETTIFVYNAGGKLVAEYSTSVVPVEDAKVQYLTNDNLGTPRINTDANGTITSRSDYMPYGEEIVSLGGRSSAEKYVTDDVRQGFTGYERDGETGLEYAQARIYTSKLGRFLSVDPGNISSNRLEAQSWNAYSYVINNPLINVDPSGLIYLRKGDTIYWANDNQWADCQKDRACQKKYKGYEVMPYDSIITVSPDENGEFYALAGQQVRLGRGRELIPVSSTPSTNAGSPLYQLLDGFENEGAMWFWRPAIYGTGTVVIAVFGAPVVAGEAPLAGLAIENAPSVTTLNLTRTQFTAMKDLAVKLKTHLNESHLQALTRDLSGNPVSRGGGRVFDHFTEVADAARGARSQIATLKGSLKNPNLGGVEKEAINAVVQKAQAVVSRVEAIIRSH